MRTQILFFLIFFIISFFPKQVFSGEWLRYAVVLQTTGSDYKDRKQLERYRLGMAKVALSYRGTPYVWGGNTEKGFDCSGFMKAVYRKMGVDLPRVSFDQGMAGAPVRRNLKSLRTGDLIYFKRERKGKWPHHVGMYLWNGWFIHCTGSKGVIVESLYTSDLRHDVKNISRIVFTEREGKILKLADQYGLLQADTGVYEPETGRIRK